MKDEDFLTAKVAENAEKKMFSQPRISRIYTDWFLCCYLTNYIFLLI